MSNCNLCPRQCGADRENGKSGICGVSGKNMLAARAALHFWEEPCISGEKGSGTVFFPDVRFDAYIARIIRLPVQR